jgi:hypothetical protein
MLLEALYGILLSVGSLAFVITLFEVVGLGLSSEKNK